MMQLFPSQDYFSDYAFDQLYRERTSTDDLQDTLAGGVNSVSDFFGQLMPAKTPRGMLTAPRDYSPYRTRAEDIPSVLGIPLTDKLSDNFSSTRTKPVRGGISLPYNTKPKWTEDTRDVIVDYAGPNAGYERGYGMQLNGPSSLTVDEGGWGQTTNPAIRDYYARPTEEVFRNTVLTNPSVLALENVPVYEGSALEANQQDIPATLSGHDSVLPYLMSGFQQQPQAAQDDSPLVSTSTTENECWIKGVTGGCWIRKDVRNESVVFIVGAIILAIGVFALIK